MKMRVLYAGDGPLGGAADYLMGVLRSLGATVDHLLPTQSLASRQLIRRYDGIIFSDFPSHQAPERSQRAVMQQVADGAGFLMIGGWASFGGPHGGWRGSLIERVLPVTCRARDDRMNLPGGALIVPSAPHPVVNDLHFHPAPMICGLNVVRPKRTGTVVLTARPIKQEGRATHPRVVVSRESYPLLVIGNDRDRRVAALATDIAPHWCGGLVDWGARRLMLPVNGRIRIEVGEQYVRFLSSLIRWLVRRQGFARHVDSPPAVFGVALARTRSGPPAWGPSLGTRPRSSPRQVPRSHSLRAQLRSPEGEHV